MPATSIVLRSGGNFLHLTSRLVDESLKPRKQPVIIFHHAVGFSVKLKVTPDAAHGITDCFGLRRGVDELSQNGVEELFHIAPCGGSGMVLDKILPKAIQDLAGPVATVLTHGVALGLVEATEKNREIIEG